MITMSKKFHSYWEIVGIFC